MNNSILADMLESFSKTPDAIFLSWFELNGFLWSFENLLGATNSKLHFLAPLNKLWPREFSYKDPTITGLA